MLGEQASLSCISLLSLQMGNDISFVAAYPFAGTWDCGREMPHCEVCLGRIHVSCDILQVLQTNSLGLIFPNGRCGHLSDPDVKRAVVLCWFQFRAA